MFLEAFLIACAMQFQLLFPLKREYYDSTLHYLIAQIYALLGDYSFLFLIEFVLVLILIRWMREKHLSVRNEGFLLPLFFAACLLIGSSYQLAGDWSCCFGSMVNWIRFFWFLAGFFCLFRRLILLFWILFDALCDKESDGGKRKSFFASHCFKKVFFLLILLWAPILILSYPGNVCYDVYGQICQVLGRMPYSQHHPLLHTFIVGLPIKASLALTKSPDPGLFVYVLFQACFLASALAGTIAWLKKEGCKDTFCAILLGIYCLSPMYSNYASTAIKDIPFSAAVVWYILLCAEGIFHKERRGKKGYCILFAGAALLVSLLRNNGIYLVLFTGIALLISEHRQYKGKAFWRFFSLSVFCPVLLYVVCSHLLSASVHASPISKGEMLSVPFQQTARCLKEYGTEELTIGERNAIDGVLQNADQVAEWYTPDLADPVKAFYRKDATNREIGSYLLTWFRMFFRHPDSYFQAFLQHVYGWFDPLVTNAERYEADVEELFARKGLFAGADKVLVFFYRFLDRISVISVFQNVGIYVWAMLLIGNRIRREYRELTALWIPLLVSLLVCMASPCFFHHARYAFPILFTIPFLYGALSCRMADTKEDGRSL